MLRSTKVGPWFLNPKFDTFERKAMIRTLLKFLLAFSKAAVASWFGRFRRRPAGNNPDPTVEHPTIVTPEEKPPGSMEPKDEPDPIDLLLSEALSGISIKGTVLWGIDAGHNQSVQNNRSPVLEDGSVFFEWKSNRNFALMLGMLCDRVGLNYIFTNPNPDSTEPDRLSDRSWVLINAETELKGKEFISLHSNAAGAPNLDTWVNAKGSEVLIFEAADSETEAKARIFNLAMAVATKTRRDRGVKRANLAVLRTCWNNGQVPGYLLEPEFHNDREGVRLLMDPDWRIRYLVGVVRAMAIIEQTYY